MNILFFGEKRHGSGSHEYQRHVVRNLPIVTTECYGRKLMMDNQTYFFDRFDGMGNAIFVDDQWDEETTHHNLKSGYFRGPDGNAWWYQPDEIDRMADDGCPCHG